MSILESMRKMGWTPSSEDSHDASEPTTSFNQSAEIHSPASGLYSAADKSTRKLQTTRYCHTICFPNIHSKHQHKEHNQPMQHILHSLQSWKQNCCTLTVIAHKHTHTHEVGGLRLALDIHKLDIKVQGGIGGDDPPHATSAVGHLGRNCQPPFVPHAHANHTPVPALQQTLVGTGCTGALQPTIAKNCK